MMKAAKERRPFLRRTKATAPPDTTDADATTTTVETTTNRFTRRGNNRFKIQKTEKEKPRENDAEKPSSNGVPVKSDRPRNFIRRRLGGANGRRSRAQKLINNKFLALRNWFVIQMVGVFNDESLDPGFYS
ncbi:jg11667 [Pararge aegeria aegeria]|uniref:Jg11667 protein n=1 Tax=Pararge aegeria aegeria TaxID=348720 RepID=A0A8S4RZU2_9NEOP|nr:jg11667 [Pararge aegeria aegeria]